MDKLPIKQLRKYLGKTQAQFANELNVSRSTYALWEAKNSFPPGVVSCIKALYRGKLLVVKKQSWDDSAAIKKMVASIENIEKQISLLTNYITKI